jgi:hypothetical protein
MRPALLLSLLLAMLSPMATVAQSSADFAYCQRLADLYDRYLGRADYGAERGYYPGGLDTQVASSQCRQGNPAGIPVLERVLRNNGFTLPPRG